MAVPTIEVAPQWQNYVDLQNDVKGWLAGYPVSDTSRDAAMQLVIDAACQWVQTYLGRPIAPTTFFQRFNGYQGWGGSVIELPYYPVLGTPTVTEYWGNSGPHVLALQTPEAQGGADMFTLDPLRGWIIRSYLGLLARPTFPGLKNIEVTWTAGHNPIPAQVKIATLELIKWWWVTTQQSSRSFQVRNEYDELEGSNVALWPAVPSHVTQMLEPFVQIGLA